MRKRCGLPSTPRAIPARTLRYLYGAYISTAIIAVMLLLYDWRMAIACLYSIFFCTYHYVLNAQGDVVQINYQGKQNKVYARYTYDANGNVLTKSGSLADVNPLRYRGYYCDTETGFYTELP